MARPSATAHTAVLVLVATLSHLPAISTATGCAGNASIARELTTGIWLCAFDRQSGTSFRDLYSACNEADNYHLATVTSMTPRGAPIEADITQTANWARSLGFDYMVTGQPVRSGTWAHGQEIGGTYDTNEGCAVGSGGLGYIGTGAFDSGNWQAMTDGNGAELRGWPSANCAHVDYHTLISLCQDARPIENSCVYDHRWRVGTGIADCITVTARPTSSPTALTLLPTGAPTSAPTVSLPTAAPASTAPTPAPTTAAPTASPTPAPVYEADEASVGTAGNGVDLLLGSRTGGTVYVNGRDVVGELAWLRGEATGLRGEVTGLRGEAIGLRGEVTRLRRELAASTAAFARTRALLCARDVAFC